MKTWYIHPTTGSRHVCRFPCGKCGRVECGVEDADFRKWSFAAQALEKEQCEAHAAQRVMGNSKQKTPT